MPETIGKRIPPNLLSFAEGRDRTELQSSTLLRYQQISLTPDISKNFRFLLLNDGGIVSSTNKKGPPANPIERFNTPLPSSAVATLAPAEFEEVRRQLSGSGFFNSLPYQANEGVRDGALVIVTARSDTQTNEVWYLNVRTGLTDYLWQLHLDQTTDPVSIDDLADEFLGDTGR